MFPPRLSGGVTISPIWISEAEWSIVDFGDAIPLLKNDPIFNHYGKSVDGDKKCLIAHLESPPLALQNNKMAAPGVTELDQLDVSKLASEFRWEQCQQALERVQMLGGPDSNDSLTVAELGSHTHDILFPNHDRDYKSLIRYTVSKWKR